MNPRRWVLRSAWTLCVLATACLTSPAGAQFVEAARTPVELPPDPIARSMRLLGMGRLTLLQDRDNHIELWDFAGNPVGLYDADSNSVLDVRPATRSSSSVRDFADFYGQGELQTSASHDSRVQVEAIRRPGEGTVYGVVGELNELHSDAIYSVDSERRSLISNPLAIPVITGKMPFRLPFLNEEHMRYALFGVFGYENMRDDYQRLSRNAGGQYVDHDGTLLDPPGTFTPDEYFVQRNGGGLGVSYRPPSGALTAAITGKVVSNAIEGKNEGNRYASETRERRPIFSGQGTLVGRLGKSIEWGADGQAWSASSQSTWVYSISPQGGPGPQRPPLAGRGDLSKRKENGTRLRLRGRWFSGANELGASFGTESRKVVVTPSPLSSSSSFNSFRYVVYSTPGAVDTTALPDDVLSSNTQQRNWEAVGGLSRQFRRGVAGVEYHYVRRVTDQKTGQGAILEEFLDAPQILVTTKAATWDVRGGLEYRWTEVLTLRGGYSYRSEDRNELVQADEYIYNTATGGFALHPPGVRWSFEAGYAFEWSQADYGAPERPRATSQHLGTRVRWDF